MATGIDPNSTNRYEKALFTSTDDDAVKIPIIIDRNTEMTEVYTLIDERPVVTYTWNPETGKTVMDIRKQENVELIGDVNLGDPTKQREIASAWLNDVGTNWRVEDKEVVFSLPDGTPLVLPRAKPGKLTPKDIPPVYGQPNMIFTLAMGLEYGVHTILSGPTGTGKTTSYQWLAEILGYNFIRVQIDPKTEGASLVGEYLPVAAGHFEWCDGPVTEAVRMSQTHPTILVLDELSRIGNVAELSRLYSLLDDGRTLYLPEKAHENNGEPEIVKPGKLFIGATMNPADDEGADYIGVRELDPALMSRFTFAPKVGYPQPKIEVKALCERVPDLPFGMAERMVQAGNSIRDAAHIHYPFSFRELVAWALALPYFGVQNGADVAFITKAHPQYQDDIRGLVRMV